MSGIAQPGNCTNHFTETLFPCDARIMIFAYYYTVKHI